MKKEFNNDTLYLRLPARYAIAGPIHDSLLAAAVMAGNGLRDIARVRLQELGPRLAQASEVVLLLSASDVTLFRCPVPPMSPAKLRAALPSLAEAQVMGDTADCAIVAGPDRDGQRVIAVCDRGWLQLWISTLRDLGARKIRAIPVVLCLPPCAEGYSATVLSDADHHELVIRLSDHEGIGLPLHVDTEAALPAEVTRQLSYLAGQQAMQLAVPTHWQAAFEAWMDSQRSGNITLVERQWQGWIAAARQVPVNLADAIDSQQTSLRIDGKAWRWPALLAGLVVLFNIAALNADWWRLRSEGLKTSDEIAQVFRLAFPNETVVLDPLAQMKQKVAVSQRAAGQLLASDFIVLTAALGEAWREAGMDPQAIASLRYREGKLDVALKQGVQISQEALRAPLATRRLQILPSPSEPIVWQLRSM